MFHICLIRFDIYLSPFYRWRDWDLERLTKSTQGQKLGSSARILTPKLMFFPPIVLLNLFWSVSLLGGWVVAVKNIVDWLQVLRTKEKKNRRFPWAIWPSPLVMESSGKGFLGYSSGWHCSTLPHQARSAESGLGEVRVHGTSFGRVHWGLLYTVYNLL